MTLPPLKCVKEYVTAAEGEGAKLVAFLSNKGHFKLTFEAPDGRRFKLPCGSSPSDVRGMDNFRQEVRKKLSHVW